MAARMLTRVTGRWQSAERLLGHLLVAWGFAWWAGAGAVEIVERADTGLQTALLIDFFPISALLLSLIARRVEWRAGGAGSFVSLVLLVLVAAFLYLMGQHPFADWGFVAWPVAIAIQYGLLRRHAEEFPRLTGIAHTVAVALVAMIATAELRWQLQHHIGGAVWPAAAASFVPGLLLLGIFWMRDRRLWPVSAHPQAYALAAAIVLLVMQWLAILQLNGATSGDPSPLPYFPFINPADLATAFSLLCTWHCLRANGRWTVTARIALAGVAFVLSTVALLRAMHHLGGVPWLGDAMLASVLVQAAVSVYWGLLAFGAMAYGARRAHRGFWIAGAALMGLVVVKLFLVELGSTGTVARIVSFIAIGALLLVLGYVAPAPPRAASAEIKE
jgi:uncharacterized membrane protein